MMKQGLLFQYLQHQGVGEGFTTFSRLLHFTLIMLIIKQGRIKYHLFCVFDVASPGIEPRAPRPLGEHSTL